MRALIPCRKDNPPSQEVLDSIKVQGAEYEIVDCTIDGEMTKYGRIAKAKEKLRLYAMTLKDEFLIFNDRDMKSLFVDNFSKGLEFLTKNRDFGAVSFARYNEPLTDLIYCRRSSHVCNSVMVVRVSALNSMRFDTLYHPNLPDCFSVGFSLKQAGYSYGYLDKIKRVKHLGRS